VLRIHIRNATPEDCDEFVECYIKAYRGMEIYAYKSKREIKRYFRWLIKRDRQGVFSADILINNIENNIENIKNTNNIKNYFDKNHFDQIYLKNAGFLACDSEWFSRYEEKIVCEIHEIFVNPEWRGIGIGSTLMNKTIEYASEKKRDILELWVGEKNYRAIAFYQKFGFEVKDRANHWLRMTKFI